MVSRPEGARGQGGAWTAVTRKMQPGGQQLGLTQPWTSGEVGQVQRGSRKPPPSLGPTGAQEPFRGGALSPPIAAP